MRAIILASGTFILIGCNSNPEFIQTDLDIESAQIEVDTLEIFEKPNENIDTIGFNEYWSNVNISSATLYAYVPEFRSSDFQTLNILNDQNELNPTVLDSFTVELDSVSLIQLKQALTYETTYESIGSDCFNPHHGIVMKDKSDNPVGHISICFQCGNYSIRPEHVNYLKVGPFRSMIERHNIPTSGHTLLSIYKKQYARNQSTKRDMH